MRQSLARAQNSNNAITKYQSGQLKDVLDNQLAAACGANNPGDYEALQQARTQYRNMKLIEGAVAPDGSGDISYNKLTSILNQKSNRFQSVYGKGDQDLVQLAQAARQVLPEGVGNSGTAARIFSLAGLNGIPAAAGIALHGGIDLGAAGYGAATGYIVPNLLQRAMNNSDGMVGNYLVNGINQGYTRNILEHMANNGIGNQLINAMYGYTNQYPSSLPYDQR